MYIIKKIKNLIKQTVEIKSIVVIEDEQIKKVVEQVLESHRNDFLPHGACWLCSHPISKKGGYEVWNGKLFCSRLCTQKFATLVSKPDDSHFYINGTPVEVVDKKIIKE